MNIRMNVFLRLANGSMATSNHTQDWLMQDFSIKVGQTILFVFVVDFGFAEWEKDEDPWKVHAKYCPVCLFLKKSKGLKYIRDIQTEWRKIYKPLKPSMEDEANRIKTFQLSDEYNWKCIAGEKLKVVCHYCNCQLEPWIHDCDPWLEHVKRMTECKFVEIRKGKKFISRILARMSPSSENSFKCSRKKS
ncbi:BIRC2_3 [Mytilus edulis]|uniref:BIRC2_3 n=1 Tax=Mytilus edulis TaxID=6550 RepID=A0A8S3RUV8_MYTED|nr:BIRC2_3 [Mytilus edulis]